MTALLEEKTQFRHIGNSLGVIVPASIRRAGGFEGGDEVIINCPRPGVITISCVEDSNKSKSQSWSELQQFVSNNKVQGSNWPSGKTFKQVLNDARDERFSL